jgi:hypothetical protein
MPMPKPLSGESKDDFISRGHSDLAAEFPDPKQRHAILVRQWVRKGLLDELLTGAREEMEHTKDPLVAIKIALDHLKEDIRYYQKLGNAGLVTEAKA